MAGPTLLVEVRTRRVLVAQSVGNVPGVGSSIPDISQSDSMKAQPSRRDRSTIYCGTCSHEPR